MPTYNSLIDRTDAGALIPEEVSAGILQAIPQTNPIFGMMRRLPDMSRKQLRCPVLSVLPTAAFLNGDTTLKQTSEVNWDSVYVNAEELAVIVPIPDSVADDADYDLWAEIQPHLTAAFGKAIAAAIIQGTNKPTAWPDDLVTQANAAGQKISLASFPDVYDAILGDGGLCSLVEADGYMVNGHLCHATMRGKFRGLRDANGNPIFTANPQEAAMYYLDGSPCSFLNDGSMSSSSALQVAGDWSQAVWAMRQDITFKMLDQAVIQDGSGNIVYNLAQQDMRAIRAVMRIGWALPNPPNFENTNDSTRFPFSVLTA